MGKDWSSKDKLPEGFTQWFSEVIRSQELHRSFQEIAAELGVAPSILSRWVAGWGPLNQVYIDCLALKLGPVIYSFLRLPRPDSDNEHE